MRPSNVGAFALCLIACSSSSSSSSGGDGPQGVDVPIATAKSGSITVFQQKSAGLGGTNLTTSVSAIFYSTYDGGSSPACVTKQYGACLLHTCDPNVTSDTTKSTSVTAGDITITGFSSGDVTLAAGGTSYSPYDSQFGSFTAGSKVEITAPGDASGAPAFDLVGVAPDDVVINAPTFDPSSQVAPYHAGDDLPVSWTPTQNGKVQVNMINARSGVITQLSCTWDGSAGSATIPGATIDLLGGDAGGYDTGFYVLTDTTVNPSGWTITETLQTRAYAPGKTDFAGGTLELD